MRQSRQVKKEQIIGEWAEARRELLGAVESLPPQAQDTPFLGVWSSHDIVAHLIGWDYANLEGAQSVLAGRLPEFYNHYDPDWRSFNATLVARHKRAAIAETIAAARASQMALAAFLEALTADEFVGDHGVRSPRGRRVTIAMLLSAETRDERKHEEQAKAYRCSAAAQRI